MNLFAHDKGRQYIRDWVIALRSGKYKQGTGALCRLTVETGTVVLELNYCCLGVLCEVLSITKTQHALNNKQYQYGEQTAELPYVVMNKTGLNSPKGAYDQTTLIRQNDSYEKSFNEIADIIEFEWMKQFNYPLFEEMV